MSKQEKSAEAALHVCWTLSKHQKTFSDSEIMKECMLEVASALFEGKKDVFTAIQSIPMSARTNDEFIKNSNIHFGKLVSLSTDGASAMIGKGKGAVKKIRDQNPGLISYQCIIHQTALCGKLSATLKEVMDSLVQLINFMRSHSSLQHRKFKKFLSEGDAAYSDLL
ncbi:SCAN domain-containing protein 3-like [Schistocerca piceifrons]|uniref:SCAN domain-containing protein 3-like n=1 Tax=Schistocerca piceifrons TaxID=274613 RepID=UPI001F5F5364|nr:SCAN domain-containing protein 3-like [Schistocerca piceifrons]